MIMRDLFCVCLTFYGLFMFFLTCQARNGARRKDGIGDPNDYCEDCLCSWFCTFCTQCMLIRHEGLTNGKYDLCSENGEKQMV
jgi:hypothetical protein